ncbi:drug/metabolite transporter (DMT)-like permease [Phycicoccus badiiscoriae]|uniref:Drug/metabolite transporter (DMT)-like permease n=1 Tax=Pedococcus badiiscoriae TaxID=642776 RepID=A0A852WBG4_9MICO|nr:drug/metabolite transporter (DMT)-like permease [Pedococcus badiiscoriae]
MNYPLVVAASLASTVFFAVSTVLKHHSAATLPATRGGSAARARRFVASTVSSPWWLGGMAADAGGLGLQAFALHIGAVSVVQPLLVTSLLTSLLMSHLTTRTRVTNRELRWGALLVLAIVGFLTVSGASSPHLQHQAPDRGAAAISGGLAVLLAISCVVVARRVPSGRRAALLATAVGTLYAFTAVLIKAVTEVLATKGLWSMLTSWQLLVLLTCGAAGLLMAQMAFRAGPLHTSLPIIATVDPLLSVALGVVVYDEQLRSTPGAVVAQALLLVGLAIAVFKLSRLEH